jgi:hypothetical protein
MSPLNVWRLLLSLSVGCGFTYGFYLLMVWLGPGSYRNPPSWVAELGLVLIVATFVFQFLASLRVNRSRRSKEDDDRSLDFREDV